MDEGELQFHNLVAQKNVDAVDRMAEIRQTISFELYAPYEIDSGDNYMCTIRITGAEGVTERVGGVDSMQALSLAVMRLQQLFAAMQSTHDFYWVGSAHRVETFDSRVQ